MLHVPYKGTGLLIPDLIGGRLNAAIDNVLVLVPHVKSGAVRALAVTAAKRSEVVPELPTIAESGVPGFENSVWQAMLAPAKTPQVIRDLLMNHAMDIARQPDFRERMMVEGSEPQGTDAKAAAAFISDEIDKWRKVAKAAGLKPQ